MGEILYSLTNSQKSIYLTEEYASNTNLNNISGCIKIKEPIDFNSLEKALNIFVQKNDAIRLRIVLDNGTPKQYIKEYKKFSVPIFELENDNDLNNLNKQAVNTVFNFIDSDLFSFYLFKFPDLTGGFVFSFHHIISDAWSTSLFLNEVMEIYTKIINKEEVSYSLNSSYIDYINSENEYLSSSKFEKDKEFWNTYFSCSPELAKITNNITESGSEAARECFHLEKNMNEQVLNFCKNYHCSVYTFFLCIFSIYLSKINNIQNPIIGTPVLNRSNFKEKNTCGMYISTIPFKSDVKPDVSFSDFLKNTSVLQMSIYRHQKYPYTLLLEELKHKYNYTQNLYDVVFSYQNARDNSKECKTPYSSHWLFNGQTVETLEIHFFDMDDTGDFDIFYDYQISKLTKEDITKIHNRILNIVLQVIKNPNILLKDVEIATLEERNKILNDFNNTSVSYDKNEGIVSVFEKQVENHKDDVALVFEDETLTYLELNRKANELARFLIKQGAKPNDKIAIYLPRCSNIIVSMLAIKKAGCAYLLVESSLPVDRICYMLTNSNVAFVITNKELYKKEIASCILLENVPFGSINNNNLNLPCPPEDYLSVVYTSGSTGMPKGILVKNFSMLNLVLGYSYSMNADKLNNFISICSVSFDMFAAEVWIPLLLGKKLVLANEEESKNPILMSSLIEKEAIEFMLITSSKMNLLLLNSNTSKCLNILKAIQLGGEVLNPEFYSNLVHYTNAKIYNGYGPSETTSCATCKMIDSSDDITIGKPLPNVKVYICNEHLNLCPPEITGELCIAGDGVSYGYVNEPELTNKNFVKNPFGDGILYKTGDLAKFLPNGEIAYIGRNDSQVKIRGLRIELEEINKVILKHDSVQNSVTVVKKVNDVDSICCYLVSNSFNKEALKDYASKKLPYYMVPSHFILLDKLPITTNGKIDFKALPDVVIKNEYAKPETSMEKVIATIWGDLLNIKKVSVDSNFFELGGDSLSAIKFIADLDNNLHIRMQVKDVFNFPTVRALAKYIKQAPNYKESNTKQITKIENQDSYIASSAQKRIYYTVQKEGENSITYNTPGGLIFKESPDIVKLENSFTKLIELNEALRTYFVLEEDEVKQKIMPPFKFKLEVINVNSNNMVELFDSFIKPFDLSKAPLFRAKLALLEDGRAVLLLDMHHIICDGESIHIFLDELCEYYKGNSITPSPIDYKDYAYWEKQEMNSYEYKEMEKYWLEKFSDEIPTLNMPTSFSRPANLTFEGHKLTNKLENANKIHDLCTKLHITPYQFFLAMYYILLYEYTGQDDIIVGTPVVGRPQKELHSIVGMFVNTLALREKILPEETVFDFISRISNNILEDFKNDFYPFDELVNKLKLEKDSSRNPLFDTMFVYQNEGMKEVRLGNLTANYYIPDSSISKFDFTLEVLPDKNNFVCNLEYNNCLYKDEFMKDFLIHYLQLVNCILENPHVFVKEVSILTPSERKQILDEFNSCNSKLLENETVISLFESQVKNSPEKTALIFENKKLSYDDLNKKANQIANFLISKNIKRNSVIGILLPREPETIIFMLGILKAGCAYMLIDHNLPYDRILYMLENSKSPLLFTNKEVKTIDYANTCFIEEENFNLYRSDNLCIFSNDEDLFSVIYTSGSTGTPKGVMLKRKGVINLLRNHKLKMNTDICENFISVSTISFDMFMVETFIPLLSGKTMVLTNEEEQKIPVTMAEVIKKYNIDFLLTTPSRIELLLSATTIDCLKSLKVIQLGGEIFTQELYSRLSKVTQANIYNAYGPTEVTACCSCALITNANDITIGKSFEYAPIYICNQNLGLCPKYVPGEICVTGNGISNGYLNSPELTQKSFVKNPYGEGTLYRTGDIGYYREDGNIVYIGRKDFQIKIRGLRVELSEIENKILELPEIKNCSVLYKKEENDAYLVCFYTVNTKIEVSKIRSNLKKSLPLYMVPKYMICLETMPITANGKVNKKLLENYEIKKEQTRSYVAPQTDFEKLACHVWEQLLNTKVGIEDDIFELGADSLLAIKFKTELLAHEINVPYSDIFKYTTVKELGESYYKAIPANANVVYTENIKDISAILDKNTANNIKPSLLETKNCNNILLLGGNGFVGMHILDEFIKKDEGNIYCIIRSKNNKNAKERFMDSLHFYFGNELDNLIGKRIFIIEANITEENFGLTYKEFEELTNNISIVIDSAAMVKHYGDSNKFKHINVDLTKNIIHYCLEYNKRLLYISTISIAGNSVSSDLKQNDITFSESCFYIGQKLDNLYIKSKFDAESLVFDGISNGLNAQILRLGNITSRYADGKFQINSDENAFINRIKSFMKIGFIPNNLEDLPLEFTPVDICATAIINILQNYNKNLSVFHLYNDNFIKMSYFIDFAKENGHKITLCSETEFQNKIHEMLKDDNSKDKLSGIITDIDFIKDLSYTNNVNTTCELTKFFLHQLDFHWPIIDTNYLKKYLLNL